MSEIKIEKGVPIPAPSRREYVSKYPWRRLEVGDSFFAADKLISSMGIDNMRKKSGFNFTARTVTENGVKGVRVWRIA